MRITWYAILASAVMPGFVGAAAAENPTPIVGFEQIAAGMPTGPSPDAKGNLYGLRIFYFDAIGGLTDSKITVPDIPVTAGLPNPTAAQVSAASAAKAAAIAKAINAAKLNGVTAAVDAKTIQGGVYPTGQTMKQNVINRFGQVIGQVDVPVFAPADFTSVTINGVRQAILNPNTKQAKLGAAIYLDPPGNRVTGENGNGKFSFKATGGTGSMFQGTFNGTGSGTGLSTGLDASGFQSVVGFGFIDLTSSTPVDFIAAFDPPSGITDADVLGTLALLFNQDFASMGYTATYDPATDILSIDQPLPSVDMLWSADSDTGVGFDSSPNTVPEPATLGLLSTAMAVFGILARRRKNPKRS